MNVDATIVQRNTEGDGGMPTTGAMIVMVVTAIIFNTLPPDATLFVLVRTLTANTVEAMEKMYFGIIIITAT